MKIFTPSAPKAYLGLLLKIILCMLWLLCIISAAFSRELPFLPVLGQQPGNQTVCAGSNPVFTIGTVSGTSGTVTYQWQVSVNSGGSYSNVVDGASYSGASGVTLTVLNVSTALNGNLYRCRVTDGTGTTTSNGGLLTVNATPAVSSATRSTTVCVGATAGLAVTNDATLSYQWQLSTDNGVSWANATGYSGSNSNDLTYPAATLAMNGYLFRYIATNTTTLCSATSVALDTLKVLSKPVFSGLGVVAPTLATICPGGDTSFIATPSGAATMAYQWQLRQLPSGTFADITDGTGYSGSQTNNLHITGFAGAAGTSWQVQLIASYPSTLGCASSSLGAISVRTMPSVALQPKDTTVCANSPAGFKVTASGSITLLYQWQTDNGTGGVTWSNSTEASANTNTLSLGTVTTAKNGWRYRVIVSNSFCGAPTTSQDKVLTVRRSGTWLGAKDTAWQEPMNWCGGVPDNTIDVLVPNWPTKMPLISDGTNTAFYKSLEIENAARLTISGGTIDNMTGPFNLAGTVAYTATRDQEIFPANHGSLEINGTGNKYLRSNVDISNNLVLGGSAKLATRTNFLTMKNGSNTIATNGFTGSATSWVVTGDGSTGAAHTGIGGLRIEQIDATDGAVLFPVGPTPAAYNPLRLSNTGTIDNFTIAVNDQRIPGGIINAGVDRTWSVTEAVPGASNVTLSLRWQGGEEQSAFDRTKAMVIRSNGTSIVESSSVSAANGANPYTSADGIFTTLTLFSVASNTSVLPVELRSFTAQKTGTAAVGLNWNTTGVLEAKYFTIQRSTDGVKFVAIGKVNGETGKTAYNYTDNLPGSGMVYYRLQIVTQQNEMVYTGIQSVLLNSAGLVQLRPSVTNGAVTNVYVYTPEQSMISLYITDVSGRIHVRQTLQLTKGANQLPLWIGSLGKGVYYVHVKDGSGNASVTTLVKQ
ncbi:hypothetical protein A3860_20260 [Niastella vici]|uniref:Ig-like domain-containing protein n=1 Tax=Niastella vici TaxID=1703345 RepID=A0A1V9G0Z2_9BACT|nr:T9SS type A sorting domain-containing protein [Niastella vici]OQP64309.1 hypothetical protein A3860_20260 [Niastella vici]